MFRLIVISTVLLLSCPPLFAQATNAIAPGAPGLDAHWPSAAKNGFGTANTLASKVWFTLNNGIMTEVYYPTLDVPNVQTLQFLFVSVDGKRVETEAEDMEHSLEVLDPASLTFRQVNKARSGDYTITKTYVTDPARSSILIDVKFNWTAAPACRCSLYVSYDPSLNNSGMHDSAWIDGNWLVAADSDKASALTLPDGLDQQTNGYLGTSDGLTQLRQTGRITPYPRAGDGNVVQTARVRHAFGLARASEHFSLVLGFGSNAREAIRNGQSSMVKGFALARAQYEQGWHSYVKTLPRVEPKFQAQFKVAAMVLKALEDKTHRGAMIASPSIPWGGGANANEPTTSGYHAVWARDLYQVATAFLALGDRAGAERALTYLFKVQQKADGSFPQNSWVDGRPIGGGLQLDQVGLPLVLAYQLQRTDRTTWLKHVKPAADFILRRGAATEQERWEEKPGYSPSTIAAEIAGLVCASRIAALNQDGDSAAAYLRKADEWARVVEHWTATSKGPHANDLYYLRITRNKNPNDDATLEINSGGGIYDQREIVDAGFLELVRMGIKAADDPVIVRSLAIVDNIIKVETPGGSGWYRYNHDAYGERPDGDNYDGRTGVGRLWTLLTGERGEYEVARGDLAAARARLDTMMSFANDGMMIPEQVWDRKQSLRPELRLGEGTGSATPLAWSMAQFIRLAVNVKRGRNVETPALVAARYRKGLANN
ncbi:MAG TPA: glycoside hydrolase family 15 protein [Pyrinomonadaceae bacterium]|nr:glycoside hydrolase family 15 protein [Pyrinomonadaceae bacterium]